MNKIDKIKKELMKYSDRKIRDKVEYFFKTDEGGYSEHDKFIGVKVPDTRKIAQQFSDLKMFEILELLESEIHEERLLALIILSKRSKIFYKKKDLKNLEKNAKFYLKNKKYVNN